MSLSERRSDRKFSLTELSGYAMLVTIIVGFLALHILAGRIVWPASKDAAATTEPAKLLSGD
jgi:hypothetical protein